MPSKRAVDHQYLIRARPAAVFRAISDPKWLTRWLCDRAELVPRRGGPYLMGWTDGPTHEGRLTDYRRGRRIAFAWTWPGVSLRGTIFALAVERADGGTLLRVTHTGFPRQEKWADLYGGAEWGWTYFAMNLKALLETGRDLRTRRDG